MQTYNPSVIDALNRGKIVERALLLISLESGDYGFWTGEGDRYENGQLYVGAGQLISTDTIGGVTDLSAVPAVFRMSSIPNTQLSPDILASIEQENYRQRPVTLSILYLDPLTKETISIERVYRGYIDRFVNTSRVDGEATLEMRCESKALDHSKTGYRTRSDLDQRRVSSTDTFYLHVATTQNLEVNWGRNPWKPSGGSMSSGLSNLGLRPV